MEMEVQVDGVWSCGVLTGLDGSMKTCFQRKVNLVFLKAKVNF